MHSSYESSDVTLESRRGRIILIICILASGLGFLKGSVVSVALPVLQHALDADVGQVQWVANSYLLSLGSLILLSGSLGDLFGLKRIFCLGIALLGVSGVLSAVSWNTSSLIVFHGLQGVGAALMIPGSLAIIRKTFPESEQGRNVGLWAGWSGAIAALGPFVGGALADISWRAVFWLPVPIALAAFLAAWRMLPSYPTRAAMKLDWAGTLLIVPALSGISYSVIRYPATGFSPDVVAAAAAAAVAVTLFVLVERHALNPVVPPAMFNRSLTGANIATFFQYFAFSGTLFAVPFAVQQLEGASAATAGIMLLPATVLIAIGSGPSGAITDAKGPVVQMRLGPLIFLLGVILMALAVMGDIMGIESGTGEAMTFEIDALFFWFTSAGMLLVGVGMVLIIPAITTSAMNTSRTYAGGASGLNNAVSRVAGLFANAVIGATLVSRFRTASMRILEEHGAGDETIAAVSASAGRLLEIETEAIIGPGASDELSRLLEEAFRLAYTDTLFVNIAAVVLAFLSALVIRARR